MTQMSTTYEKIILPQMRYKLKKLTQEQTLIQISELTSGFYFMSPNSADWIQCDVRSREFTSFGKIPGPDNVKYVNMINGDNDYFLKLTSKKHNIDYIWYDKEKNEFHFWGEYQCCIKSMNELRYRIHKVVERFMPRESKKYFTPINDN